MSWRTPDLKKESQQQNRNVFPLCEGVELKEEGADYFIKN
jgi:hypothetical protein